MSAVKRRAIALCLIAMLAAGCPFTPIDPYDPGTYDGLTGINAVESDNSGSPKPQTGAPVSVRVRNLSHLGARVTVVFTVLGLEVHRAELRAPAMSDANLIGPDVAEEIRIAGNYSNGLATPSEMLLAGSDFEAGDEELYTIPPLQTQQPTDNCPDDPDKTEPGICGCGEPDSDADGDGSLDCVDACPDDPNKVLAGACGCGASDIDANNNGTPDCNDPPPTPSNPPSTPPDSDNDTIIDPADNCPFTPNTDQADSDEDGRGDACDNCIETPNNNQADADADGYGDACDLCPEDAAKIAPGLCGCGAADTDSDNDETPDCHDDCPNDPNKTEAGECGCDEEETDTDQDGTPDCIDECPDDPDKTEPGVCGCGQRDRDRDGDGTEDCNDQCPGDPDKVMRGKCGCFVPETDTDNDGTPDCNDQCPTDPNKTEPGDCGCGEPEVEDCGDACPDDPDKTDPGICGCGTPDTDSDNDETPDCNDACPNDADKTQPGECGCGTPDTDSDDDGTADCNDECPDDPNKTEPETCGCGESEADTDNDQTPDCNDGCPLNPNRTEPDPVCGCAIREDDCNLSLRGFWRFEFRAQVDIPGLQCLFDAYFPAEVRYLRFDAQNRLVENWIDVPLNLNKGGVQPIGFFKVAYPSIGGPSLGVHLFDPLGNDSPTADTDRSVVQTFTPQIGQLMITETVRNQFGFCSGEDGQTIFTGTLNAIARTIAGDWRFEYTGDSGTPDASCAAQFNPLPVTCGTFTATFFGQTGPDGICVQNLWANELTLDTFNLDSPGSVDVAEREYVIAGSPAVQPFKIQYLLSDDPIASANDTLLGQEFITQPTDLSLGAHKGAGPTLQVPANMASETFLYLLMVVDADQLIFETNEQDNVLAIGGICVGQDGVCLVTPRVLDQ